MAVLCKKGTKAPPGMFCLSSRRAEREQRVGKAAFINASYRILDQGKNPSHHPLF